MILVGKASHNTSDIPVPAYQFQKSPNHFDRIPISPLILTEIVSDIPKVFFRLIIYSAASDQLTGFLQYNSGFVFIRIIRIQRLQPVFHILRFCINTEPTNLTYI